MRVDETRRAEEIGSAPLLVRPVPSQRILAVNLQAFKEQRAPAEIPPETMTAIFQSSSTWPVKIGTGKLLTFGDFVAGVYYAWGKRKAKGVVQLAVKAHIVEFRGAERFRIS